MRLILLVLLLAVASQRAIAADSLAVAAPAPSDTTGLELEEKRVRGRATPTHRMKEVSRIRLKREDLQKVAAAQGDPFKALGTLPGVTNQNDMSVRPFVRGGKAEETQVLWEGIPLIQPYHFASVYSIFNMEGLEDMTLYSGGFPASVGNALSGAILMRARPAPLDSFRLYTDLSVLRGLGDIGVPLVKDRLGVSFAYQAFWYDWAIDRGWDLLDLAADDSALSAEKERFREYLDLPNFRDYQFGLNSRLGPGLTADYTGIVSRDIFTVREAKHRYSVNGAEVSPTQYERSLFFGPETDVRERLKAYDSLAVISVNNYVHAARLHWKLGDRWQVDQAFAYQAQDWHVGFFDAEVWTDTIAPDGRYVGYRRPAESDMLFKLRNEAVDWRLDVVRVGEDHRLSLGLSQTLRIHTFDTRLPRPVYETIVNGSVDAMDGIGLFDPDGFLIRKGENPAVSGNVDYLDEMPRLIRFDYAGRQSGTFLGAYLTDEWSLDARHRLTLGLRTEVDSYSEEVFLSPRFAWFQALGDKDELTLATGLYSQSDFPFHVRAVNPGLRSEKAFHANLEWTHAFSKGYRLEVQAYQKNYYDLVATALRNTGRIDWKSDILSEFDSTDFAALPASQQALIVDRFGQREVSHANTGLGKAGGTEISFFYDPSKVWSGWVTAEAGYSKRRDRPGTRPYNFRQSRPWAFNWVNYFHMPSNYELSIRGRFAAGQPYTGYLASGLSGETDGDETGGLIRNSDTVLFVGPRNHERYGPYSRWDIRLSKDIRLGQAGRHVVQSYFEVWNAFNTPNFVMADARTKRWKFVDLNYPVPILFLGLTYRY